MDMYDFSTNYPQGGCAVNNSAIFIFFKADFFDRFSFGPQIIRLP
jgi:hypothetical protein